MSDKEEVLKNMVDNYRNQMFSELDAYYENTSKRILRCVPDHLKTAEMCEVAVEYSSVNLWDVPCRFITKEMCERVVMKDCGDIRYVPDRFTTKEMCERVVREYSGKDILRLIPDRYCTGELLTKELCEKAVLHNYENLTSVPYECLTEEIWDSAKDHLFFP